MLMYYILVLHIIDYIDGLYLGITCTCAALQCWFQYVAFAQAVILQSLFCHELAYENNSYILQTEQHELEG